MRQRTWTRRACWVISCAVALLAARASAQTCNLPPRPQFAGHTFPLDSPPVPQALTPVSAFPGLPPFSSPLFLTYAPDGSNRIFVVEQGGLIKVFANDAAVAATQTFLDLSAVVDASNPEMGLLGLAFDPGFASNGYFYVNYTASNAGCAAGTGMCTRIVRYTVPAATPDAADPASAYPILEYVQPYINHNGGMMTFGPDGMLWIAAGDGGSAGDPQGNGQNVNAVLGKLLRIDPSGDAFPADPRRNYKIPPGNPYAGGGGAPEWWARGLRNPWRFSFDRVTGDLYIGDVGQDSWEEVDFVSAAERAAPPAGGFNFGWNICEGTHDYSGNCAASGTRLPQIEYGHDPNGGYAVTGGYAYRGDRLPSLYGAYLYGDFESNKVWIWNGTLPAAPLLATTVTNPSSFGEDRDGELYVTSFDGHVYRFDLSAASAAQFPSALSATGLFSSTAPLAPAAGLVEYSVNAPQWADRALLRRWVALPAGQTAHFRASGSFDFPIGTALVQQIDLPTSPTTTVHVETRILLRQLERWAAFSYRWNAAQTDATLVTAAASDVFTVDVGGTPTQQTWSYPGPGDCLGCHSQPERRVLGPRALQLNASFAYPSGADNQIHAWTCMGMFDRNPQAASAYGAWAAVGDTSRSTAARARSYLAANCASCHQPGGPTPVSMDLRSTRLLGELNAIGVDPTEGSLGLTSPQRIRVGVPEQSVLQARQISSDASVRMPDGSLVPDPAAAPVFDAWIRSGLATLDSDEDGVADASDDCPRTANASQADAGGFNTSTPDGVGDACQCGDVSGDGKVDSADLAPLRAALAHQGAPLSGAANRRCVSPSDTGECSIVSWARMRKALAGTPAAHGQTCPAATELGS